MIASLAPCFTGTLLRFANGLALSGEHAASIPGAALLDPAVTERLLSRFAQTYPGGDRRAVVSVWTQWHFGALVIPTTAAILLLGRDLPVDLQHVSVALHDDGRTAAIVLRDDGAMLPADGQGPFARLFQEHVEPLVRHLAAQFGVSPRLLWTNAADIFEWTLQQVQTMGPVRPSAMVEARALLERRTGPERQPHPMVGLVRYGPEGPTSRKRKICCLRYLLPGVECCGGICPLPPGSR